MLFNINIDFSFSRANHNNEKIKKLNKYNLRKFEDF